jgi:hypothetical protein
MKNFRAEDMPSSNAKGNEPTETEPVKDKHTDQINEAAGAGKKDNPAGKTAAQVVADSKDAEKAESKDSKQPENDFEKNNEAEAKTAKKTTTRRRAADKQD